MNADEVRHIAVLRANGLGDDVFCLPALDALPRARACNVAGRCCWRQRWRC
jgi:hypothetical protein